MRYPQLRKQWIDIVVQYIRENYKTTQEVDHSARPNTEPVDAIVGPDNRGTNFALPVATILHLPYIPIHEAGAVPAEPDDVISTTYIGLNQKQKVFIF